MWSFNVRHKIIRKELSWCFYLFYFCGFQYFNLNEIESKKLSKKFIYAFSFFLVIETTLFCFAQYYILADIEPNLSSLNIFTRSLVAFTAYSVLIISQILTFMTSKKEKKFLKAFMEIDKNFNFDYVKIDYKKFKKTMLKKTFISLFICFTFFNVVLYIEWKYNGEIFGYLLRHYFFLFSFFVASSKYMLYTGLVNFHLTNLLKSLEILKQSENRSSGKLQICFSEGHKRIFLICKRVYGEISELAVIINETFGWVIVGIFIYSLVIILLNFFGIFRTIIHGYSFQFIFGL